MELEGTVKFVGETVDVGTAGFQKRELVISTEEQYPQHILINFVQDKCNLLATTAIGDKVSVSINIRGREWINPDTTKNPTGAAQYFNDIQGWKIKKNGSVAATSSQKYVHTATDATYAQYKATTPPWTDEQLVQQGKGRWEVVSAPTAPTQPAAPASAPTPASPSEEEDDNMLF